MEKTTNLEKNRTVSEVSDMQAETSTDNNSGMNERLNIRGEFAVSNPNNTTAGVKMTAEDNGKLKFNALTGEELDVVLKGVAMPESNNDAANKKYVDDAVANVSGGGGTGGVSKTYVDTELAKKLDKTGGTMTGDLIANKSITLSNGSNPNNTLNIGTTSLIYGSDYGTGLGILDDGVFAGVVGDGFYAMDNTLDTEVTDETSFVKLDSTGISNYHGGSYYNDDIRFLYDTTNKDDTVGLIGHIESTDETPESNPMRLRGVKTPINNTDAANKSYVDNISVESIKEKNKNHNLTFWVGTQEEYNLLTDKIQNCFYIISDDTSTETIKEQLASLKTDVETLKEGGTGSSIERNKVLWEGEVVTDIQSARITAPGIENYKMIAVLAEVAYKTKTKLTNIFLYAREYTDHRARKWIEWTTTRQYVVIDGSVGTNIDTHYMHDFDIVVKYNATDDISYVESAIDGSCWVDNDLQMENHSIKVLKIIGVC